MPCSTGCGGSQPTRSTATRGADLSPAARARRNGRRARPMHRPNDAANQLPEPPPAPAKG